MINIKSLRKLGGYRLEAVNFLAGLVVLTFELSAARVVAPYIGTTIYTWTSVIGVILGALAVGYGLGGYWADKRKNPADIILLLSCAAALIFIVNLIKDWFLDGLNGASWSLPWQAFLASLVLFAAPTIFLGAVSPYLARLSLTDLRTSGRHIARINAAGTVGSLLGAFLTGYLLFGYVGTRNILGLLVLVLIAASVLIPSKVMLAPRILLAVAALLTILSAPKLHISGVREDIDSNYSRIAIRDINFGERPVRVLQTDSLALQSGIYTDGDTSPAFPYIRAFDYMSKLKPSAGNSLVIGGGAFTFPASLAKDNPLSQIDVVEIDPKLTDLSNRFFGFKQPPNLKIINTDGRLFLNHNEQVYDFIFVDAFSSITPPFQLLTLQATDYLESALKRNGLVVVNIVSSINGERAKLIEAVVKTYRQVFPSVAIYQTNPGAYPPLRQNLLLVAGQKPLDGDQLNRVRSVNEEAAAMFDKAVEIDFDSARLLTDDLAPVERMSVGGL